jgi:hypothetical protein
MEALFTPDDSPRKEQTIDIPTPLKDTIVITKIIKPVVKKTETEKRKKEGLDW